MPPWTACYRKLPGGLAIGFAISVLAAAVRAPSRSADFSILQERQDVISHGIRRFELWKMTDAVEFDLRVAADRGRSSCFESAGIERSLVRTGDHEAGNLDLTLRSQGPQPLRSRAEERPVVAEQTGGTALRAKQRFGVFEPVHRKFVGQ